ncbi:MAG: hypothetical protein IJ150_01350 [Bacteroidales bacterium]|nr:hypothetical protein [Bacteroidales bacterium]
MAVKEIVAEKMLEDRDTRMALTDVAKEGVGTAKMVLKGLGIAACVGIGGYVLYKVVGKITTNIQQSRKVKQIVGDYDATKVKLSEADLNAMADKLYSSFVENTVGYDDKAIREVLKRITTKEDWLALIETFGNRSKKGSDEKANLIWFLNDDKNGWITYKDYAKILEEKGIPNALGSLGGRRKKKKKGFKKKALNPLTPFKAVKNVNKTIRKKGFKSLLNPNTAIKAVKKA